MTKLEFAADAQSLGHYSWAVANQSAWTRLTEHGAIIGFQCEVSLLFWRTAY